MVKSEKPQNGERKTVKRSLLLKIVKAYQNECLKSSKRDMKMMNIEK